MDFRGFWIFFLGSFHGVEQICIYMRNFFTKFFYILFPSLIICISLSFLKFPSVQFPKARKRDIESRFKRRGG